MPVRMEAREEKILRFSTANSVLAVGDDGTSMAREITNCFWHVLCFLSSPGSVHYTELITHWILEGYFAPVNNIKHAYEDGHLVLMKFIDCGLLKMQEDNTVVLEGSTIDMTDLRYHGFGGTADLGLVRISEDEKGNKIGSVIQIDGTIKTRDSSDDKRILTFLIDGSLLEELPQKFFNDMQDLQVLGLFEPTFKSPYMLPKMKKLRVLVLRGCDFLRDINDIANLEELTVLEISGARSLEVIPNEFFKKMPDLESLNLSGLQITYLPSTIADLSKLRWLIVRQCPKLRDLPKLQSLTNLEVLDFRGSTSLKNTGDRNKNKNFSNLQKLEVLDLSHSRVERLPIFQDSKKSKNTSLKRLLLRGCSELTRLPNLKSLSGLQILDLSGAQNLKEIIDDCLENKEELRFLDLSRTPITRLPAIIGNLCDLKLRGCSALEELPSLDALKDLKSLDLSESSMLEILPSISKLGNLHQLILKGCKSLRKLVAMDGLMSLKVLDLSGCEHLVELPQLNDSQNLEVLDLSGCSGLNAICGSFTHMPKLQKLNLSDTNIEMVPALSNPSNLGHLILRNCTKLKELPQPEPLSKLKELDLSGAISLRDIKNEFGQLMTHLEILNLSGVILKDFSFISHLIKLRQLSLTIQSGLNANLPLRELTELQVLNLSGVADGPQSSIINLLDLSSISELRNLRELFLCGFLSLKNLSFLGSLSDLEVLDLSGARLEEFPYEISKLACLNRLVLPDLKIIQKVDWSRIECLPEELSWEECSISEPTEISVRNEKPPLLVTGGKFLQLLEQNPNLWRTCFKEFYISVCLIKEQGKSCCQRDIHAYGDIYFNNRYFAHPDHCGGCLEIHGSGGSDRFPAGVQEALSQAEYISFIENKSITCSSILNAYNMNGVKGIWLQRCTEMQEMFHGEYRDATVGKDLEILWISNLPKLQSIYNERLLPDCFNNLKHLHVDCCQMLETLFTPSQLPRNLKSLRIKFCDKLKTVFEYGVHEEPTLQNLKILHLLDLPKLEKIGVKLPSLEEFDKPGCPILKDDEQSLKS